VVVYHPAVVEICDRIGVFAVAVGLMGPDYDAAELAEIEASAEDLTVAITEMAGELATIDASSAQRLTDCTEALATSLAGP